MLQPPSFGDRFPPEKEHRKERHAYRPLEFFGEAVELAPYELFVPERGFRTDVYTPPRSKLSPPAPSIPLYTIAVERARTFELFLALLATLEGELGVILESQHDAVLRDKSRDAHFPVPDREVLASTLMDYEDLLVRDGYTGLCVMSEEQRAEVMFTEHKVLHYYGDQGTLNAVHVLLHDRDIPFRPDLKVISDPGVSHIHRTTAEYCSRFDALIQSIESISF